MVAQSINICYVYFSVWLFGTVSTPGLNSYFIYKRLLALSIQSVVKQLPFHKHFDESLNKHLYFYKHYDKLFDKKYKHLLARSIQSDLVHS